MYYVTKQAHEKIGSRLYTTNILLSLRPLEE
jgi:hypothetical protein